MHSELPIPNAELPADELAEAVNACRRQDRRLDMYYKFASPTARRFVELGFYSNYFGDRTDPELYARCRDEIAASLTESDIRYLLRFESDPDTKVYLNALLGQPTAGEPHPAEPQNHVQSKTAPKSQPTTRPKPPAKPRFPVKRKKARSRFARTWTIGQDSSGAIFLKILAALVIISAVIIIGGIRAYMNDARDDEIHPRQSDAADDLAPTPVDEPSRQPKGIRAPRPRPTRAAAPETSIDEAADTFEPSASEDSPQPTNEVTDVTATQPKKRKVVLTDGPRIRTRQDGTIEVPRVFSYAGAGLKKPFWIYDRQLEKSGRIEHEARAEKAARDKWRALYDEAVRQEATAGERGSYP